MWLKAGSHHLYQVFHAAKCQHDKSSLYKRAMLLRANVLTNCFQIINADQAVMNKNRVQYVIYKFTPNKLIMEMCL